MMTIDSISAASVNTEFISMLTKTESYSKAYCDSKPSGFSTRGQEMLPYPLGSDSATLFTVTAVTNTLEPTTSIPLFAMESR